MGGPPPSIPTRFPCWVKAVYSWGGESKRDLGFVEGDLIECLNAGDGSWWTGRLRRDRRAVGLFPSNFVQVLDESFQPAPISRNSSPLPVKNAPVLSPQKSTTFRKPFQAYQKVEYSNSVNGSRETTPERAKPKNKWAPYASMKTAQAPGTIKKAASTSPLKAESTFRVPSPPPRAGRHRGGGSRATSPAPHSRAVSPAPSISRAASPAAMYRPVSPAMQQMPRAVSPAPPHHRAVSPRPHSPLPHDDFRAPSPGLYQVYHHSRVSSPQPHVYHHDISRAASPQPFGFSQDLARAASPDPFGAVGSSPPPPAPPPHRTMYQASHEPSSDHFAEGGAQDYQTPDHARHSTDQQSQGMTPSPLRDAMADVMSSLHDMSGIAPPSSRPHSPANVWSPDAFGQIHTRSPAPPRAQSAMSYRQAQGRRMIPEDAQDDQDSNPSLPSSRDGPPQLSNYVQRMESRLRQNKTPALDYSPHDDESEIVPDQVYVPYDGGLQDMRRPVTSGSQAGSDVRSRLGSQKQKSIAHRKSAYELGRQALGRTNTTKTSVTSSSSGWRSNATTQSNSTQATSQSLMSGYSAGGISATSAGSLARRKWNMGSIKGRRPLSALSSRSNGDMRETYKSQDRPPSPVSGISYHSSHATQPAQTPVADWTTNPMENAGILGGLSAPKAKKSGFFKKMIATAKTTAKTGAANARSTIGSSTSSRPASRAGSPVKRSMLPDGITAISNVPDMTISSSAHRDMGLGGGSEWMQVRRDVNRSNSLSKNERNERAERCQMLDIAVLNPIDELLEQAEGDESLDGLPISDPTDFNTPSLALVDKSTRFIASLPASLTATTLAQSYLCRPYRSDVQRLRAIFTWVAERVTWEEDFEGQVDTRRVIQTKRGCSEEIAVLVRDLCAAVGLHAEVVRGYLKGPGEILDLEIIARPNHWWNAVIVDGEWRIMDCSLAAPTNPRRSAYSSANSNVAEPWWFLARPMEICYTHVPLLPEQQHICPPVAHEILMALPCACPPYFRHRVELADFDTSLLHLENLEMAHIKLTVPEDIECVAEIEAQAFAHDWDGDRFESGDIIRKGAFAQAEWVGGRKRYTVKALLPGDEGQGVLKIYAGKRGLMHSIKDNPHALALALPISHAGQNPSFQFLTRHPTPHAQRHDLYVVQPQCQRLVINNTFVFCIRQHPSSLSRFSPDTWGSNAGGSGRASAMGRPVSPNPYVRPSSAMSMISASASVSQSGSNYSDGSSNAPNGSLTDKQSKPAKLAVQSPSGKIIRLTRKQEYGSRGGVHEGGEEEGLASAWETVIKVGERGTWRGLVLADRSARWCVFAEWECI